jgi:tetratricopeptide (TPR) repeat protein
MAEMLGGYGEALTLAGRVDEAKSYLDEALSLSRELKNDGMVAQPLGFQGDLSFYESDFKSAHSFYAQALQAATRSKEPDKILIAKTELTKVEVQEKRTHEALSSFPALIQQADEMGLKYVSVECSIFMAQAMIQKHDYAQAKQELERALRRADKTGLKPLSLRAHFLLAVEARESGRQSDAQDEYRRASQLLDEMRKEPGADRLLQRSDLKAMYDESAGTPSPAKS